MLSEATSVHEFENERAQPGCCRSISWGKGILPQRKGFAHKPSAALYIASGIGV
jgi:hypothetical protein